MNEIKKIIKIWNIFIVWTFLDIFGHRKKRSRFSKTRIWGFFLKRPYHRFWKKTVFLQLFLLTLGSPRHGFGVFF